MTAGPAGWSAAAWRAVEPWYAAIVRHPFVTALADGTLDPDVFGRYLLDDAAYLDGYARALAATAARLPALPDVALVAGSAAAAVEAERLLHREQLGAVGIDPEAAGRPEPSPTCVGYVSTLLAAASYDPVEVAVAALLPCFRVYAEVGAAIAARASERRHPYAAWIVTYADPAFAAVVSAVEALADRLAEAATDLRQEAMAAAYVRSTRFEWMFWDAAWRGETWPTPAGACADGARAGL